MLNCIIVGLGGFLGSVMRYLIGLLPLETGKGFPLKTLIINISGAFFIGMIAAFAAKNKALDTRWILFLKVGICGGFTTFSTFAFETTGLLQKGLAGSALLYITASIALSVLAVFAAQVLVS